MTYPEHEERMFFSGEGGEFPNIPMDPSEETEDDLYRIMTWDEKILFMKRQLGKGWVDMEREGI